MLVDFHCVRRLIIPSCNDDSHAYDSCSLILPFFFRSLEAFFSGFEVQNSLFCKRYHVRGGARVRRDSSPSLHQLKFGFRMAKCIPVSRSKLFPVADTRTWEEKGKREQRATRPSTLQVDPDLHNLGLVSLFGREERSDRRRGGAADGRGY